MADSGSPRAVLSGPTSMGNKSHDVILNVLDAYSTTTINTPDGPRPLSIYFSKESFEPTVQNWNGVPVIYAREHPDPDAYDANQSAELTRVNGEVIGKAAKANISLIGNPKLMASLNLRNDKDIENIIESGTMSISTGFKCTYDEAGKITGPVKPHHVLMFVREGSAVPGDKGATILNGPTDHDVTDDEAIGLLERIKNWLAKRKKPEPVAVPAPPAEAPASEAPATPEAPKETAVGNAYPNEHAARIAEPSEFEEQTFRRKNIAPGIDIIIGKKKGKDTMETQAYRFDKKKFTAAEAKKWLKDHDVSAHKFEAAEDSVGNSIKEDNTVADDKSIKDMQDKLAASEKAATDATEKMVAMGNAIKAKDDELAALSAKVAEAEKIVAEHKTAQKEAAWLAFKVNLPKGMVHGDKEKETRAEFEKDPAALATRALTFQAQAPPATGQPAGDPNATAPPIVKPPALNKTWNAEKKAWVWE